MGGKHNLGVGHPNEWRKKRLTVKVIAIFRFQLMGTNACFPREGNHLEKQVYIVYKIINILPIYSQQVLFLNMKPSKLEEEVGQLTVSPRSKNTYSQPHLTYLSQTNSLHNCLITIEPYPAKGTP